MWLLDKALRNYVKSGEIRLVDHDGTNYRYGSSDGGFGSVTVRLADAGVARDIVRDPGLGAAEAFMDGRLIIEKGEIHPRQPSLGGQQRSQSLPAQGQPDRTPAAHAQLEAGGAAQRFPSL
jgi:hypothetical protein